jgi:BirA family biotin operon repressor/biotin-[acetyl-CoA-carboxylase] ligase
MPKLGSPLLEFDTLPSTNELAREMAVQGAVEGTTILAREQTAGRGRLGRTWTSAAGEGLYVSIILRPKVQPRRFSIMTLASAVAVAETLISEFAVTPDIKWPNDVLVSDRKVCGILLETATEGDKLEYAILGIGVNLGQPDFPDDIRESSTSLLLETRRLIGAEEFLWPLLDRLQYWYQAATSAPAQCLARWEQLSSYARDCRVRVISTAGDYDGVTRGLTETGSLIVELPGGESREVVSGEVSLRRLPAAAKGSS